MASLLKLLAVVTFVAIGLAFATDLHDGVSQTRFLDLAVVNMQQDAAKQVAWLAIGQVATGVLAFGQGVAGVVAIGQGGIGILFGLGQGASGLLAIGQLSVGLFGCAAQLGVGLQGGFGLMWERNADVLKSMSSELGEVMAFPFSRKLRSKG